MQQLNQSDRAETVAAPAPQSASELLARKSNFQSEGGSNDSERDVYVVADSNEYVESEMRRRHSKEEEKPKQKSDAVDDLFAVPEKFRHIHQASATARDSRLYVGVIDDRGMSSCSASMHSSVPEVNLGIEYV